ncbi:uncharacterized protein LOC101742174 [Bombyx mori]|uniref:uncharacterized protein LOC101742174 n=1 Tax=Bombyx mori TaxID=7091 RepID=UPI002ED38C7A
MARETAKNPPGLVIKRHNIRIWCHDCDMARLQRVVWEGHGTRLLSEVSSQPIVKRFLEAVPYIMNTIRDVHNAVVKNDLEGLMKHSGDPVPPQILSSRDGNNMTVMHKAAGLGHSSILKYIAERYPQGINDVDSDGRTPLHYAAAMRDEQHTYNTLVGLGADEGALDNKNKTPGYYINRPQEIDKNILKTLPDAPRTASSAYPSSWDWKLLNNDVIAELNKKSRRRNLKASTENLSSKNNSNTLSETTETRAGIMKTSSTHELIKDLPELDEGNKLIVNETDSQPEKLENNNETEDQQNIEENNEQNTEETQAVTDNVDDDQTTEHQEKENDSIENTADLNEEEVLQAKQDIHTITEKVVENIEENVERTTDGDAEDQHKEDNDDANELNKDEKDDSTEHPIKNINSENSTENIKAEEEIDSGLLNETDNADSQNVSSTPRSASKSARIRSGKFQNHENEDQNATENYIPTKYNESDFEAETLTRDSDDQNGTGEETSQDTQIHLLCGSVDSTNDDEIHNSNIENCDSSNHSVENGSTDENEKVDAHDIEVDKNIQSEVDQNIHIADDGNFKNNSDHNEDDDDVQVQGINQSDHSDSYLKHTTDLLKSGSAKRDRTEISSGTIHETIKRNEINGRNSQESLVEGIINGFPEQDSQDASVTQGEESVHGNVLTGDNEIDPEVTDLINSANMEMLATLVLNGEGSRLIGRRSGNTELQAFLANVPTYMQKINKVHLAAKEGNLKDLQAALDRRKFAIARDPISPNGSTPLHVATVFGKTNIMKYLGGRFPETLSAVDFEGRTALHYAAVLPDNGHYYNLLQQLGANSKDLDDNGRSAEDYYKNPGLLPFDELLRDFGLTEEAIKTLFSDKGPTNGNGYTDIPAFKTEEGRYLAKSLGDPLIKGLTEVANVKPKDPVAFLASFLQNFPESEKPLLMTQESNMLVTHESAEVENEQNPEPLETMDQPRSETRTETRAHRPIDVITVDPQPIISPDAPETAFSSANRDEHGQSMLHFAAARTHARNALFQLLQESEISLGYRDELYRTARDVSIQANVPENTAEIDKWVLHLAARGNKDKITELLLEGYDHILDVIDEEGVAITDVVAQRDDPEMSRLLASIPSFEESRESLHGAVRRGDMTTMQRILSTGDGRNLARSQNSFGRTALHVAVLAQHEDIVEQLAQNYPELLRIGDNLERTPLHYAMGVEKIESLSRVLIKAGAKRVLKDLKGRQPSYYFMNKSDILRLKEEEDVF